MPSGGVISSVAHDSPFDLAGFTPGCRLLAVDAHELHDIIDWRWYSDADQIKVTYVDCDNDTGSVVLTRENGADWGIEFSEALFDGTRQCCNSCTFCFMRQLPEEARASLMLRDDDFRLSFLQGTFVTFTNLTEFDVMRIIEQHISPLRFSLHAITADVRADLIGKKAQRGIDVAQQLLDAGIILHTQIVLLPDVNDGEELVHTLNWAYERPGIESVGIVPVGYTKHQTSFSESFNTPQRARGVIECIRPFQETSFKQRGVAWVHASDEFYRNAYPDTLLEELPPAHYYGNFDLFEDGIGIVRTFVDDFLSCASAQDDAAQAIAQAQIRVLFVCGCAQIEFFTPLLQQSPLAGLIEPLYVKNNYFGGNVDVTGLLCGVDIAPAIKDVAAAVEQKCIAVIPSVVFNADKVTLDDMTIEQIQEGAGIKVCMVSCQASDFLPEIMEIIRKERGA